MSDDSPTDPHSDRATVDELNFLSYVEGLGYKQIDPLSKEAVTIQARYLEVFPQHPMDVLRRIMENPFCSPGERISAAKTVMAYTMKAVPTGYELSGKDGAAIKLDTNALSALSTEELDQLQMLLAKTSKAE